MSLLINVLILRKLKYGTNLSNTKYTKSQGHPCGWPWRYYIDKFSEFKINVNKV